MTVLALLGCALWVCDATAQSRLRAPERAAADIAQPEAPGHAGPTQRHGIERLLRRDGRVVGHLAVPSGHTVVLVESAERLFWCYFGAPPATPAAPAFEGCFSASEPEYDEVVVFGEIAAADCRMPLDDFERFLRRTYGERWEIALDEIEDDPRIERENSLKVGVLFDLTLSDWGTC
ncbi:MAG: hypothetical protein AAF968_20035 [Pseudomonadota bacterium]